MPILYEISWLVIDISWQIEYWPRSPVIQIDIDIYQPILSLPIHELEWAENWQLLDRFYSKISKLAHHRRVGWQMQVKGSQRQEVPHTCGVHDSSPVGWWWVIPYLLAVTTDHEMPWCIDPAMEPGLGSSSQNVWSCLLAPSRSTPTTEASSVTVSNSSSLLVCYDLHLYPGNACPTHGTSHVTSWEQAIGRHIDSQQIDPTSGEQKVPRSDILWASSVLILKGKSRNGENASKNVPNGVHHVFASGGDALRVRIWIHPKIHCHRHHGSWHLVWLTPTLNWATCW